MNDINRIRTLTERFFLGETTLSEEQELYDFYQQSPSELPADLRTHRELFVDLESLARPASPVVEIPVWHHAWQRWAVAAVLAFLIAGGVTILISRTEHEEEYLAYIYGKRTTDKSLVLDEMHRTMATAVAKDKTTDVVDTQLKEMFGN